MLQIKANSGENCWKRKLFIILVQSISLDLHAPRDKKEWSKQAQLTVCKCWLKMFRFAPFLSRCSHSNDSNLLFKFFCDCLMSDSKSIHSLWIRVLIGVHKLQSTYRELYLIKGQENACAWLSVCLCVLVYSFVFFPPFGWLVGFKKKQHFF